MGLGAIIQDDDPAAEPGQAVEFAPEIGLKRNFPGLGRIADLIKQFEDVLRDFVTMSDGDTSKKVTSYPAAGPGGRAVGHGDRPGEGGQDLARQRDDRRARGCCRRT